GRAGLAVEAGQVRLALSARRLGRPARAPARPKAGRVAQAAVHTRAPAAGIIGTDCVAKSAPDGYTWVFIFDTHSVHQALNPKLPFDPVRDFAPVMIVGTAPMAITTGAGKPYKSFKDVLAAAKANPDKLTIG